MYIVYIRFYIYPFLHRMIDKLNHEHTMQISSKQHHGMAMSLFESCLRFGQKDTGDYLNWLVTEISKAREDWEDLADVSKRLEENAPFTFLKFHEGWNGKNINRTYLQLETE